MIKSVGAVAGDEESYEAFAPFFGEVLRLSHGGWTEEMSHRSVLDPSKVAVWGPASVRSRKAIFA